MASTRTSLASHRRWRAAVLQVGINQGVTHCPSCRVWLDYETSLRPNSAEPDHILPHAQGGENTVDNGRVLCRFCNQSRGDGRRGKKAPVQTIDFT